MSDVEADSMWIHCSLPDDDVGDLEATPRPAPMSRIRSPSTGVDSLLEGNDTLTETDVISYADDSDTDVFPETSDSSQATSEPCIAPPTPDLTTPPVAGLPKYPPPIKAGPRNQAAPRTAIPLPTIRPHSDRPTAVSDFAARITPLIAVRVPHTAVTTPVNDNPHCTTSPSTTDGTASSRATTRLVDIPPPITTAPVTRPVSAPSGNLATHSPSPLSTLLALTSPLYDINMLAELDFQRRQEEQAEIRVADEHEQASQERLRSMVSIFEDVSSVEIAEDTNSDVNENGSSLQTLYCVSHAQLLTKRCSRQKAPHKYPAKRGGDPSDVLVVVKYPDIHAEFSVRRFGLQEMDTRHGKLSKFRRAWLVDYQADQRGYHGEGNPVFGIRLYHADRIYRAQLVLPDMYEEIYYVDLFFRNKFYSTFGKRQSAGTPCQQYRAWCNFVNAYIGANSREANAYENSLRNREEKFYSKSVPGVAMKIHALSMNKQIPCTVPVDVECPSCYLGSQRGVVGSSTPDLVALHSSLQELLSKQKRNTTPAQSESSERVMVERFEAEISKLQADDQWQRHQLTYLTNEYKELQARNSSLQANIAAEVALQLSQHFRSISSSILSNNRSG